MISYAKLIYQSHRIRLSRNAINSDNKGQRMVPEMKTLHMLYKMFAMSEGITGILSGSSLIQSKVDIV